MLLISFPVQMTSWLPSYEIAAHIPAFSDALQMIFTGHTAAGGDMASLRLGIDGVSPVSYTHLRAHETVLDLVCRLLLEKKNKTTVHCRSASARLLPLPLSTPLPFFFF